MRTTPEPHDPPISPGPAVRPPGHHRTANRVPALLHRRDGILPAVAAALSVRGATMTCTGGRAEEPPVLHPLVAGFLATLPVEDRTRTTERCPEAVLLSRFLTAAADARRGRSARRPLAHSEARRALKHAVLTTRRIREPGDPAHGSYEPPCPSCARLLDHFGVRALAPAAEEA